MSNIEPRYLFDLDLFVYSPFWIDYSKENVRSFVESFYNRFLMEPEEMSYAWLGYDIAFYFYERIISSWGKSLLRILKYIIPIYLQTKFDFRREDINDGFENNFLFPIRYTKSYDVVLDFDELK